MSVEQIRGSWATVPDLLRAVADADPDREAFVDGDHRLTFGQWERAAAGMAGVLAGEGVTRGDVVTLLLPSSLDYAICYQAAIALGAVTSGINPRLGPAEVASILERTRPKVTIGAAPGLVGAGRLLPPSELGRCYGHDALARRPRLSASDAVAVVWTSGTTGVPKGALFDHDNLRAVAEGVGVLSRPGDRRLSPLPFAHVGFMTRPWDEILNRITTVIVPTPWRAAEALRLIAAERVSVAQGVPAQWAMMLAHPLFAETDLTSLRLAGTGAAPVAPELVREMRDRLGCPVVVRYTSTEAALTTGTRPGDPDRVLAETVGAAADGVEVEVVDDEGKPVPTTTVGTVRCRSGAVMRGYWADPQATAAVLSADRWLLTGDLGRLDEHGYLTLVGRRTEMYIRGGYNVYPSEVEAVLGAHPSVVEVAVVGLPDRRLGEIGAAVIVPRSGCAPTVEDLRTWCRRTLADYKAPDRVAVIDQLPLTSMHKVDKPALLAWLRKDPQ